MKNINFDNPLGFLILIPLILGIIIPIVIAIRKDNRSKSVIASVIIHLMIVVLVGLGLAGTVITTLMTETHVYVVADVSYSANKSLDKVDEYIGSMRETLPDNYKMGVVCFGKDYVLHSEMGTELTSVKDAKVDNTATDIASALEYVSTLFGDSVIRKVVLLTDGRETVSENASGMIAAVEQLVAHDISIDAVYLNSNISDGAKEVQLTGVDFVQSTYINHQTTADVLVQSSSDMKATVTVFKDGQKHAERAVSLTKGFNIVNFELPTDMAGTFNYELNVSAVGDESEFNNEYAFTQTVASEVNVLLLTADKNDIYAAEKLFGENARIDVRFIPELPSDLGKLAEEFKDSETVSIGQSHLEIPCSIEALCKYDEIVISNVDIREFKNVSAFVQSVEVAVSQYGKSLVTIGDTKIQNKTDESLVSLENMLPVKFGNSAQDSKLFAIVIDTSRSMYSASRFAVAKQAAIKLLSLLNDNDDVIVVKFAGDIEVIQSITKASKREDIAKTINAVTPEQGTSIGGGLKAALDKMLGLENDIKQVMLISDGMNYTAEIVEIEGKEMSVLDVASYMKANDITVSTMNPYNNEALGINTLKNIAKFGGGEYYLIEGEKALDDLILTEVADDVTEAIGKESPVYITRPKDAVLDGVSFLPSVKGYVHSKAKLSAYTVLKVDYTKQSGDVVQVPLYAYWKYGNGNVASFMGTLSGEWVENWQSGSGEKFFSNMAEVNVPEEKIDRPFTIDVKYDGIYSNIELVPGVLDPYATVEVNITSPDGEVTTELLNFDASKYTLRFETTKLGQYKIDITYSSSVGDFKSTSYFNVCYSPEYDAFANFDASTLHAAIRHRGTVSEGELPNLLGDNENVATYRLTFTVPFMIAAVILFVIDIIIRKIKWNDIKSLFKKSVTN